MSSEIKWRFKLAIISSILLILLEAFWFSIVDVVTVFGILPLSAMIWLFFIGCSIASLTCLLKFETAGKSSLKPIAIQSITLLMVIYIPFTTLWLKVDYITNQEQRNVVVQEVLSGKLVPNVEYNSSSINLGDKYPNLSKGGNDIIIEHHDNFTYVFFYTFRGILEDYSGYLYVPEGGAPDRFSDLDETESTEIKYIEDNWYFVSHH